MKMNWMKHWTKPKDSLGEPPIPLDRGAVRIKRAYMTMAASLALAMLFATPALAASDPLTAINNLSDFVFSAIKAIGAILLGFGIVQIGLALKGHDAAQRAQGFMTFFGGVVIYFANELSAHFLYVSWKRFRKYNAYATGITQSLLRCCITTRPPTPRKPSILSGANLHGLMQWGFPARSSIPAIKGSAPRCGR